MWILFFIQGVNVNLFPVAMKYEFSLRFLRFYLSPVHARAPTVDFVSPLGTHRWYRWGTTSFVITAYYNIHLRRRFVAVLDA